MLDRLKRKNEGRYLHLDIENTHESLARNIFNRRDRGAIVVTGEFSTLNECVFFNEGFELFARYEVIFNPICLSGTGKTGCVYGIIVRYFLREEAGDNYVRRRTRKC